MSSQIVLIFSLHVVMYLIRICLVVLRSFTRWKLDAETIDNVIRNRMKSGKAAGYDNLTSDHILYSHPILVTHLRNIFNLMLKHSYVPDKFGRGVTVPLVKDKRGDLFSSSNYRGILNNITLITTL